MANEEHLAILRQGVKVWNKWRQENPYGYIDFREASLSATDLTAANLSGVDFGRADLARVNLSDAQFGVTFLLMGGSGGVTFFNVGSILEGTNLHGANLSGTTLKSATLNAAILSQAELDSTIFANTDFSNTIGLDQVIHIGPSTLGIDTLQISKGKIPDVFLRGCGLSDWEIESAKLYNPDLSNHEIDEILYKMHDLRANQALQISPLFISYSHGDSVFVDKLEENLNNEGIRFWRDVHDAKAGRLEKQIERAMRLNPTVLLILSEHSLQSDWVEHEVRTAREVEKEMGRDVLCPVALDDSWKNSSWPKRVMEQVMEYNILDFSSWKDDSKFGSTFNKLIDGLELFYKR